MLESTQASLAFSQLTQTTELNMRYGRCGRLPGPAPRRRRPSPHEQSLPGLVTPPPYPHQARTAQAQARPPCARPRGSPSSR